MAKTVGEGDKKAAARVSMQLDLTGPARKGLSQSLYSVSDEEYAKPGK